MRAHDLTSQQLDKLTSAVGRQVTFLRMLQRRMNANRFPADDPLRLAVQSSLATADALFVTLRRLSHERLQTHDDYFGNMTQREWKRQQRDRRG